MEREFIRQILLTIGSIGQVEYRMKTECVDICRDDVLFGKAMNNNLYLLSDKNKLVKLDSESINDQTIFYNKVKEAYDNAGAKMA